jgi:hypothetical protein
MTFSTLDSVLLLYGAAYAVAAVALAFGLWLSFKK